MDTGSSDNPCRGCNVPCGFHRKGRPVHGEASCGGQGTETAAVDAKAGRQETDGRAGAVETVAGRGHFPPVGVPANGRWRGDDTNTTDADANARLPLPGTVRGPSGPGTDSRTRAGCTGFRGFRSGNTAVHTTSAGLNLKRRGPLP